MKTETANGLSSLKAGDKVIRVIGKMRLIRTVRSAEGSLIDIGTGNACYHFDADTGYFHGRRGPDKSERIELATPELVAEVERENAEKERQRSEAVAKEQADPRTPYIRRFRNGDFEPWDKLTLEQLQQVSKWLELE